MSKITDKVCSLIEETVKSFGVELWDVAFVKEGASHYLRVFIDKPQGITIDDCTDVSHAIDPIIDEADPIDVSYYLEVSSPGLNRELTKGKHFLSSIGKPVSAKLYKAIDGTKQLFGVLTDYDGGPVIETENGKTYKFSLSEISKINLNEEF
ncbi:MAG: ribosome maturation factor RimP [Clostridia bacterium]|nr:ribosome maturation factor RimP [Clostridia bacterium]